MRRKSRTFGETLVQGAGEAAAIARGAIKPARVTRRTLTAGEAEVHEPPRYGARRIRKLRESLNMSQPVFARSLNASDATVKAWEQGKRTPDGTSLRLLELAEKEPQVFINVVGFGPSRSPRYAGRRRKAS
ncbi:MAG: helix-turn-helix domain-containing protein [Longimicrobiales bacterium]